MARPQASASIIAVEAARSEGKLLGLRLVAAHMESISNKWLPALRVQRSQVQNITVLGGLHEGLSIWCARRLNDMADEVA